MPPTSTEVINGSAYLTTTSYDAFNRVSTIDYPSGFSTMNVFNEQGNLYKIVNKADNTLLWQTDAVNSIGQITDYRTGNGLITKQTYHSTKNRLLSIHTAVPGQNPLQDLEFQWLNNGNLQHRKKWINRSQNNSLTERFTYDDVNRLEQVYLNNIPRGYHNYDDGGLGNIVYKRSDDKEIFWEGAYGQNNTGPHALTSFTTTDLIIPQVDQIITYSSFEKVTNIYQSTKSLSIQYGFHKQRIEQDFTIHSFTKQKRWTGACEYIILNGHQTIHTYLSGPQGVYAIHVKHPNGNTEINYIHKDHLGSWHTITDQSGVLLQELSFDAWGQRRNPETWRFFTGAVPPPLFDRGFTGHEHLYAFDLINMNGRVYDPLVSRFLSPDPYIQAPGFSQSFNRYSYVWNNPLKYVDPDGEFVQYIIFTAFIYLATAHANRDKETGKWAWNPLSETNGWFNDGKAGLVVGVNVNPDTGQATYHSNIWYSNSNDWMFSVGGSYSSDLWGVGIETTNSTGYGFGIYSTRYGNTMGPDGYGNSQAVGGYKFITPYGSLRWENDVDIFPFSDGGDRWRTNALEFEIYTPSGNNILIGSFIYTNSPVMDEDILKYDRDYKSRFWNSKGKAGTYSDSQVYTSPVYMGWRNGNKSFRYGWDHPVIQDVQQNGLHLGIRSPLLYTPYGVYNRSYSWSGYYNPYSLFYY